MKKVLNDHSKAGSKRMKEPRLVGSIVEEMLEGWHRDTELAVNVKTMLRSDERMKVGKDYQGVLRLDWDAIDDEFVSRDPHMTFVETLPWTMKRNPHVFNGKYISVTRRSDGTLRPNFKPMSIGSNFNIDSYAIGVCNELRQALEGKD